MNTAILLCRCTDRTGIVSTMTNFVSEYRGNIVDLAQHTDDDSGSFLMRLVWDLQNFALSREELPAALEIVAKKFEDMHWELCFGNDRPRVAIFCSKTPHCLADLLLRQTMGELKGEISIIVSNHQDLQPMANNHSVPFVHIPVTRETKPEAEEQQLQLLRKHKIDLVVLARYMQILSPDFVRNWPNRIINIHHSFLPAFAGAKPYHQAKQRGVKIIGATAHYVTADLDQGPIIEQDVSRVSHNDSVTDMIRKGRDLERQVLGRAVRLHLDRRILVESNRTIVFV